MHAAWRCATAGLRQLPLEQFLLEQLLLETVRHHAHLGEGACNWLGAA